jgi:hypothetical protein
MDCKPFEEGALANTCSPHHDKVKVREGISDTHAIFPRWESVARGASQLLDEGVLLLMVLLFMPS